MSEEDYIKVACYECRERISLPADGVGVAFNCPHCGVDLQMLLKHVCEHCGGRLSFDENPGAIGVQIECGHCHQATVLKPSTFLVDNAGAETEPAAEEEYDGEEYDEEGYDDEGGYDEEDEPEPEVETRRRTGPPKPRPPGRKGLPKPRLPKRADSQGGATPPGQRPAKIGRTLAGVGAKPKEEESSGEPRKRPRPKRRNRPKRSAAQPESQPASGPVNPGVQTRRITGATPESQNIDPMDPMGGVVPGDSPSVAGPAGPGPVQRKVAGAGQAGVTPQPSFNDAAKKADDDDDGPWYENKEKKKLAIVAAIFLLVFIPFGLPATAGLIFDSAVENEVKRYVRLQFLFGGGSGDRNNRTKHIHVDSLKIQPGAEISYVVGEVKNTSSETFEQVQLNFYLYDSSGQKVGEAMDYKEEMGPNTPWNLKAACQFTGQSTNVARATLVEVIVR